MREPVRADSVSYGVVEIVPHDGEVPRRTHRITLKHNDAVEQLLRNIVANDFGIREVSCRGVVDEDAVLPPHDGVDCELMPGLRPRDADAPGVSRGRITEVVEGHLVAA